MKSIIAWINSKLKRTGYRVALEEQREERRQWKRVWHLSLVYEDENNYRSRRAEIVLDAKRWFNFGYSFTFPSSPSDYERGSANLHAPFLDVYAGDFVPVRVNRWAYALGERWFKDTNPRHVNYNRTYSDRGVQMHFYRYEDTVTPEYVLNWALWETDGVGYSDVEWWRDKYVVLNDIVWGHMKYECVKVGRPIPFDVVMPERTYKWIAQQECRTWWRPRGTYRSTRISFDCDPINQEEGIPFPGKGENAWDIGMDGLFGTSISAEKITENYSLGDAVAAIANESRTRRGFSQNAAIAYEKQRQALRALQVQQAQNPASMPLAEDVERLAKQVD